MGSHNLKEIIRNIVEAKELYDSYVEQGVKKEALEMLERRIDHWRNKLFSIGTETGLLMIECEEDTPSKEGFISIPEEKVMFMTGISEDDAKLIIQKLYPNILEKTIKIKSLPVGVLLNT